MGTVSWSWCPRRALKVMSDTVAEKSMWGSQKIWKWPSLAMRAVTTCLVYQNPPGLYQKRFLQWSPNLLKMFSTWNTAQRAGKPILPKRTFKVRGKARAESGSVFSYLLQMSRNYMSRSCNLLNPILQAYKDVIIIVLKQSIYISKFYLCVYIYICVYVYICGCVYIHMYACTHAYFVAGRTKHAILFSY